MMSGDRYTFCSSKLVLILHTPCSHFGPYIFRKIFLSHANKHIRINIYRLISQFYQHFERNIMEMKSEDKTRITVAEIKFPYNLFIKNTFL
jgi:hypothetical protein